MAGGEGVAEGSGMGAGMDYRPLVVLLARARCCGGLTVARGGGRRRRGRAGPRAPLTAPPLRRVRRVGRGRGGSPGSLSRLLRRCRALPVPGEEEGGWA